MLFLKYTKPVAGKKINWMKAAFLESDLLPTISASQLIFLPHEDLNEISNIVGTIPGTRSPSPARRSTG